MSLRFLRSLDPYHQRIGYLAALTRVARRGLDSNEALRARLESSLFEEIEPADARYRELLQRVPSSRMQQLESLREHKEDRAAILRDRIVSDSTLVLSALWLCDGALPSPLGFVGRKKVSRIIDLAKWTGLISASYELTDQGQLLRLLVEDSAEDTTARPQNWLNPRPRLAVQLFYLRLVLATDILVLFVLSEVLNREQSNRPRSTRGNNGVLLPAAARMLEQSQAAEDVREVMRVKSLSEFVEAISSKESTEENYLRPRMEIAVDLGLADRVVPRKGSRSPFPWSISPSGREVVSILDPLLQRDADVRGFLDNEFFQSVLGAVTGLSSAPPSETQPLKWFARAFGMLGREIGFTPGLPVAELACLLASEAGEALEVRKVAREVLAAARMPIGRFLEYSGGSRFDDEFLVRIKPGLMEALES